MPGFEFLEEFASRADSLFCDIIQTLADTFIRVRFGGNIEQMLVGGGILNDGNRFSVERSEPRAFGLPELLHEIA